MFFQKQIAQALLEAVDLAHRRKLIEVGLQLDPLLRPEVVPMPAHQRQQPAMLAANRIDLSPTRQKVVIDQANHMEPVGHDFRLGEVFAHHRPVPAGQIHAHHSHPLLARHFRQVILQGRFTPPQHHIEDPVPL